MSFSAWVNEILVIWHKDLLTRQIHVIFASVRGSILYVSILLLLFCFVFIPGSFAHSRLTEIPIFTIATN